MWLTPLFKALVASAVAAAERVGTDGRAPWLNNIVAAYLRSRFLWFHARAERWRYVVPAEGTTGQKRLRVARLVNTSELDKWRPHPIVNLSQTNGVPWGEHVGWVLPFLFGVSRTRHSGILNAYDIRMW